MATGTVKWFNGQKGYGFIQPDDGGKDVFVHISAVERAGLGGLNEGQKVKYDMQTDRGKASAGNLSARKLNFFVPASAGLFFHRQSRFNTAAAACSSLTGRAARAGAAPPKRPERAARRTSPLPCTMAGAFSFVMCAGLLGRT